MAIDLGIFQIRWYVLSYIAMILLGRAYSLRLLASVRHADGEAARR